MRVIVMVKATKDSEAGTMPSPELLSAMGAFNETLIKAGIMVSGEGLHPSSRGYRVKFSGKDRQVMSGPFAETKELVSGFWIWDVQSMEEAIEWVKKCPNPMPTESEIEIRKFFSAEDFAPLDPTGEFRAKEQGLRDLMAAGALETPRFEKGPEIVIAGLARNYMPDQRSKIPLLWQNFSPFIGAVPTQLGQIAYGVVWSDGQSPEFNYMAGVEVKSTANLPSGFTQLRIAPQQYAIFAHNKHVSKLSETMDAIYEKWFPTSGFQAVHAPAIERYSEAFNPHTGLGGMEVWIPVKK